MIFHLHYPVLVVTFVLTFYVMSIIDFDNCINVAATGREIRRLLAPRYGDSEAKAMSNLIFHSLKGWNATQLIINADKALSQYIIEKIDAIVGRLLNGEPLQYIIGEARFYGLDLKVSPDVLIPRQETEELVDLIVQQNQSTDLKVLDIGTGSGAIAIALSRNLKFPSVLAIDISEGALSIAKENAKNLHAKIDFMLQDVFVFAPKNESLDIIVSNPPYIVDSEKCDMDENVLEHEPHTALFVPDDNPLIYYSRIAEIAIDALVPGGKLYFEINPLFDKELKSMLCQNGFVDVGIVKDISHRNRFAFATKPINEA